LLPPFAGKQAATLPLTQLMMAVWVRLDLEDDPRCTAQPGSIGRIQAPYQAGRSNGGTLLLEKASTEQERRRHKSMIFFTKNYSS
jgi:hypothetical protein